MITPASQTESLQERGGRRGGVTGAGLCLHAAFIRSRGERHDCCRLELPDQSASSLHFLLLQKSPPSKQTNFTPGESSPSSPPPRLPRSHPAPDRYLPLPPWFLSEEKIATCVESAAADQVSSEGPTDKHRLLLLGSSTGGSADSTFPKKKKIQQKKKKKLVEFWRSDG